MPMQIYATECAAQVSTLACSILRRTPVVRSAVSKTGWSRSKIFFKDLQGVRPCRPPNPWVNPVFDLFRSFFRNSWSKLSSSSQLCPSCPKLSPSWPLLDSKWGVRGDLGAKFGTQIDQKSIKKSDPTSDRFWDRFLIDFGAQLGPKIPL